MNENVYRETSKRTDLQIQPGKYFIRFLYWI